MIKLIVSDLDGTLLPYGQREISHRAKGLIYKALDMGIDFAVSSGRTYLQLAALLPEFLDDIYYIADDGAYYVRRKRVLYSRHIDREELSRFSASAAGSAPCIFHGAFEDFRLGDIPKEYEGELLRFSQGEPKTFNGGERIYKITSLAPPLRLPPYSKLRLHWNAAEGISATQYVNRFCNKGASLSDLKLRLFLSGIETAILGDAENDIPMMKGAKYAYAIGDASRSVASAATNTAASAEEALERILCSAK